MRFVLHIGAHRTGSSLLQSTIRTQSRYDPDLRAFRSGRHAFVDTADPDAITAVRKLFVGWREGTPASEAGIMFRSLADQVKGHAHHLVYSNENLCGGLNETGMYPKAHYVAQAVEAARLDSVHVVLYVRRQSDWIVSLYHQHALESTFHYEPGLVPTLMEFCCRIPLETLSWWNVIEPFAEVLGAEHVTVLPMELLRQEGAETYLQDFSTRFWTGQPLTPGPGSHERRSLSKRARALIQAGMRFLTPEELAALGMHLETALPKRPHETPERLPDLFDEALMAHHEASNRALFSTFVPETHRHYFASHYQVSGNPETAVPS